MGEELVSTSACEREHKHVADDFKRIEGRIDDINNRLNSTGKTAWAFVGTAALAFISMLVNIFVAFFKGN